MNKINKVSYRLFKRVVLLEIGEPVTKEEVLNLFKDHPFVIKGATYSSYRELEETINFLIGEFPRGEYRTFIEDKSVVGSAEAAIQQYVHYALGYGLEHVGGEHVNYIPKKIEGIETTSIPMTLVESWSKDEFMDALKDILCSDKPVDSNLVPDICYIVNAEDWVTSITNREVIMLLGAMGVLKPKTTDEAWSMVNYIAVNTVMIKKSIVRTNYLFIPEYKMGELENLLSNNIELLAEGFNRYKNIALYIKSGTGTNKMIPKLINKISKKSKKLHVAVHEAPDKVWLAKARGNETIPSLEGLKLVSLLGIYHSLNMIIESGQRVFRNRYNGIYMKDTEQHTKDVHIKTLVLDEVYRRIKEKGLKFSPLSKGIAIPRNLRQFSLGFPNGSVMGNQNSVLGISWKNTDKERVDYDIHFKDVVGTSYGWNSIKRSEFVTFSGDITDAPNGAIENMLFSKKIDGVLYVHLFNDVKQEDTKAVLYSSEKLGDTHTYANLKVADWYSALDIGHEADFMPVAVVFKGRVFNASMKAPTSKNEECMVHTSTHLKLEDLPEDIFDVEGLDLLTMSPAEIMEVFQDL